MGKNDKRKIILFVPGASLPSRRPLREGPLVSFHPANVRNQDETGTRRLFKRLKALPGSIRHRGGLFPVPRYRTILRAPV